MNLATALWVGIAGGLGSVCRWLIAHWIPRGRLPWSTLAVNVVGSLLIGLVMAVLAARGQLDSRLRVVITAGFLGGFTTYSSFALDTVSLVESRQLALAAGYVALTVVACLAAVWLGLVLGRR